MIHYYELAALEAAQRYRLLRRAEGRIDDLTERVRPIVQGVKERGDQALVEFTRAFDKVEISPERLRVSRAEIDQAYTLLDARIREAIEHAIRNIRTFHQRQMPHEEWYTEIAPGIRAGEKITPITSVGLYVPRGKGAFPSVMYMLATPASIAGVPRIVVTTPPGLDGTVDPASLVAADLCGVHEIYRVGGAQAIAALAYGTDSIARVHKLTGPGSGYVAAAKRLLYGTVDVGLPAGPSEAILLADESADPELVARDLLVESEHGPDSSSLLVTASRDLANAVQKRLPEKIVDLPEPRRSFCQANFEGEQGTGGIVLAPSMREAIDFVNEYAPEHLLVQVRDPFATLGDLKNAGEILLGAYTPIPTGNYSLGTNAVLPTGGFAHTFSCTTVYDFLKRSSIAYLTEEGYNSLSETTRLLAEFEGFPAHARAVTERQVSRSPASES